MKTELIHMSDDYDALRAGQDYIMTVLARPGRSVRFTNIVTHKTFSLYTWQVKHALLRGMMHKVMTDSTSDAMHAQVVSKLCHKTDAGFIY